MESAANMARADVNLSNSTEIPRPRAGTDRSRFLIAGAWSGVVGALLTFVANGLHPHPSDFHLEVLLKEIAQNPYWPSLHLLLLFALALVLGALLALTFTIDREPAATVVKYAWLAALLGGSLIFVSTAMDGFSNIYLARAWMDAPAAERATALRLASALYDAQYAVYSLSVVIFLGVGIFLYGIGTVLSGVYPKLVGWLAVLSGAGAFAVGVLQVLNGPAYRATEIFFVVFSMLSTLWVLTMGILMWRKVRDTHTNLGMP